MAEDKKDWVSHALQTGLIKSPEDTGIGTSIAQVAMKEHEGPVRPVKMEGEEGYKTTRIK